MRGEGRGSEGGVGGGREGAVRGERRGSEGGGNGE